jgi:hypothetical protein
MMGIACFCMFTKHMAFFCCSGMEIAVGLLDSMLNDVAFAYVLVYYYFANFVSSLNALLCGCCRTARYCLKLSDVHGESFF